MQEQIRWSRVHKAAADEIERLLQRVKKETLELAGAFPDKPFEQVQFNSEQFDCVDEYVEIARSIYRRAVLSTGYELTQDAENFIHSNGVSPLLELEVFPSIRMRYVSLEDDRWLWATDNHPTPGSSTHVLSTFPPPPGQLRAEHRRDNYNGLAKSLFERFKDPVRVHSQQRNATSDLVTERIAPQEPAAGSSTFGERFEKYAEEHQLVSSEADIFALAVGQVEITPETGANSDSPLDSSPADGTSADVFGGLGKKKSPNRWLDEGRLTKKQYVAGSLVWEYELSKTDAARRMRITRATLDKHLASARKNIDQARAKDRPPRS